MKRFVDVEYDPEAAAAMIAEAYPDGLDVTLSYRDVQRGYLAQPTPVATDIQAQLAEIGINITLDLQESGTFIDNSNAGSLPFFLLGWGADYPDATNFLDFHFGEGGTPAFGTGFSDIHELLSEAGSIADQDARNELYAQVNAPARRVRSDGARRLWQFRARLQGGGGGRSRQPAEQREPLRDGDRGPRPVRVRPER